MELSKEGLEAIKQHEGFRASVYLDPIGLPTVGYGHLLTASERRRWPVGAVPPPDQLDEWLRKDLEVTGLAIRESVRVALPQPAYDALVSFIYNVGVGAFKRSTLLRRLNEGKPTLAGEEFLKWDKAGGKRLPGLTKRRQREREMFLKGFQ